MDYAVTAWSGCSLGHDRRQLTPGGWPERHEVILQVGYLPAQPLDLVLLQLDDLDLLLEVAVHLSVLVGGGDLSEGLRSVCLAALTVQAKCSLQVVHLGTRNLKLPPQVVDLFDEGHILLKMKDENILLDLSHYK